MPQNYCVITFNIHTNRRETIARQRGQRANIELIFLTFNNSTNRREAIARQRGDRATKGESLRLTGDILQDKVPRRNWKIRQTAAEASRVEIDSAEVHRTFVSARRW